MNNNKHKSNKHIQKLIPSQKKFECSVCYGDGKTFNNNAISSPSGKIITRCKHDICASCYTNIIIMNGKKSTCPVCRGKYLEEEVEEIEEELYHPHITQRLDLLDLFEMILPRINIRREYIFL